MGILFLYESWKNRDDAFISLFFGKSFPKMRTYIMQERIAKYELTKDLMKNLIEF